MEPSLAEQVLVVLLVAQPYPGRCETRGFPGPCHHNRNPGILDFWYESTHLRGNREQAFARASVADDTLTRST